MTTSRLGILAGGEQRPSRGCDLHREHQTSHSGGVAFELAARELWQGHPDSSLGSPNASGRLAEGPSHWRQPHHGSPNGNRSPTNYPDMQSHSHRAGPRPAGGTPMTRNRSKGRPIRRQIGQGTFPAANQTARLHWLQPAGRPDDSAAQTERPEPRPGRTTAGKPTVPAALQPMHPQGRQQYLAYQPTRMEVRTMPSRKQVVARTLARRVGRIAWYPTHSAAGHLLHPRVRRQALRPGAARTNRRAGVSLLVGYASNRDCGAAPFHYG